MHLACLWTWNTWNPFVHEIIVEGTLNFDLWKDITNANPYLSDICPQSSIELEMKGPNFNVYVSWQFNSSNLDLYWQIDLHLKMKWINMSPIRLKEINDNIWHSFCLMLLYLWFSTSIRNNFLLETCSGPLSTSDTLTPQIYAHGLDGRHPRPVEKRPFCVRYLPLTSFCTQTLILTSLTL